jgi:hypothetical protein
MAINYLFDSNIVIYFLGGFGLNENALKRLDNICKEGQNISVISKLELLGFSFISESDENEMKEFIGKSVVHFINEEIEKETIQIRKAVKIKLADAIIAATCIANDFTLLTRNVDDFKDINRLKIVNPFVW